MQQFWQQSIKSLFIWGGGGDVQIHRLYYSPLCLSGIREYRKSSTPSVSLSVHPCAFFHDNWIDFLHIGYHDQVPWATGAYKIEFGSMPHLSNYGNFPILLECLLWYLREECSDFVNICYSYQVLCSCLKKCHLALYQIEGIMTMFSYILCICCDISKKNGLILYIYDKVIRYYVLITHFK